MGYLVVRLMKALSARMMVLLFSIALEASAASQYKLLSNCDESSEVHGLLSKDSQITIHFAIASAVTCYSVTATVDGKQVRGYVLDPALDGVLAFEKAGIEARSKIIDAAPTPPSPAEKTPDPAVASTDTKKPVEASEPAKAAPKPRVDAPHR
jgi:hypothetical protein